MQINCFSPTERFLPPSSIYKFTGLCLLSTARLIKLSRPALCSNCSIVSSVTELKGSILYLRVPWNSVGSCGITVTLDLKIYKFTSFISIPSIYIEPDSSSIIRDKVKARVDFPAPVLPTTPTLVPGSTNKLS